jgi:hypothetical protein
MEADRTLSEVVVTRPHSFGVIVLISPAVLANTPD